MYFKWNIFQVYVDTHQKLPMKRVLERSIVNGENDIKFYLGRMETYFCRKIELLLMAGRSYKKVTLALDR